jgi:hypothetical protein
MHPVLAPFLRNACEYSIRFSNHLLEEANSNLFYLFLSEFERQQLSTVDLIEWIEAILKEKREQLQAQQGSFYPMCFYCWYDAMSGQLRFSLVSASYQNHLPFRCTLRATDLLTVLHQLLFPDAEKYKTKVCVDETGERHPDFYLEIWTTII